jgi:type III secretion protein U
MSEKTEQPTAKRLRDSRKKGQVANSKDMNSTALLIVIFSYLGCRRDDILQALTDFMQAPSVTYTAHFHKALSEMLWSMLMTVGSIVLPLVVLVAMTGVACNVAQVGFLLAFQSIKPDINKLNPMSKIKQMFSMKNLIELLKSTCKILFLCVLVYFVVLDAIDPLLKIPFVGLQGLLDLMSPVLLVFAKNVCFAYVIVAFFDIIFQRKNHMKQLMMSKDEVKREYKEMEGSPEIKGKRKQLHRELLQGGPVARTKKASVLVTNPTHYAVALFYNSAVVKLPFVIAKGTDLQAQMMKRAAKDFDIPIMEDVPLAHALYDLTEEGQYIPRELIEPVAHLMRWVQEQKPLHAREEDDIIV